MTSPNIDKPESTNEKYNDVYSRGSSFGQDLTESGVRKLLTGRIQSPLSQFLQWGSNLIGNAVNDVVDALTGEGASYEVLTGAAVERLGDIRTQITEASNDFQALADKAEELDTKQDVILEDISAQDVVIEQAKTDASKAIQDAGTLATALEQYQSLNDEKVRSAVATAEGANEAITDLNTQFASKVNSQIASSSTISDIRAKASTALSDSGKAIDWLKNPIEIGSSLITYDPETKRPDWWKLTNMTLGPDHSWGVPAPGLIAKGVGSGTGTLRFDTKDLKYVKVSSELEYEIKFWARGSSKSKFYIQLYPRDDTGNYISDAIEAGNLSAGDNLSTAPNGTYPVINESPGDTWKEFRSTFRFAPGVNRVALWGIFWNHPNGTPSSQVLAGLEIAPKVPTQAQVDDAQNKAIAAHNLLWDKQEGWNATQERINKLNSAMWDKQGIVNTANVKAIKALSRIDIGESLIAYLTPTDAEVQAGTARYDIPVWSTAAPKSLSVNHEISQKLPEGYRTEVYYASSTDGPRSARTSRVKVRPGTKYIWSFWARGSGNMVIYMYGNGDGYPIRSTRQIKVDQATYEEVRDEKVKRVYDPAGNGNSYNSNGTQWLLNGFKPDKLYDWTHYKFEVEFTPSTTEVWFNRFYWNWTETSTYGQYLANMQFYPDVPTQADVNKALFDSDEALKKLAEEIDARSQLNTDFDREQERINDLVQTQLWNHQDMIEQLDIRAPKTAGRKPQVGTDEVIPYISSRGYKDTHPYFVTWVSGNTVVAAMRGSWVGQYEVNINWTNGAIDRWTVEVTATKRVFQFTGGASHISMRYITSTVFPRSLCRKAELTRYGSTISAQDIYDPEGLIRKVSGTMIRLKNRATCSVPVYYNDEQDNTVTVAAGKVIPSGVSFWIKVGTAQFTEVDDPGKGEYSISSSTPPDGSTVSTYSA